MLMYEMGEIQQMLIISNEVEFLKGDIAKWIFFLPCFLSYIPSRKHAYI